MYTILRRHWDVTKELTYIKDCASSGENDILKSVTRKIKLYSIMNLEMLKETHYSKYIE